MWFSFISEQKTVSVLPISVTVIEMGIFFFPHTFKWSCYLFFYSVYGYMYTQNKSKQKVLRYTTIHLKPTLKDFEERRVPIDVCVPIFYGTPGVVFLIRAQQDFYGTLCAGQVYG